MSHEDKLDQDDIRNDGVRYYPASTVQLQSFVKAREALSQLQTPVLIHAGNPHERLYIAAFDGTGNDELKDPDHKTNVARINDQIVELKNAGNTQIGVGYVPGPGTQDQLIPRLLDGMDGHTYDARIEEMYKRFIDQVKEWRISDPHVEIRLSDIGFSRGAEQAAGFARLVHERGIQDPAGAHYTKDANGQIIHVEYTKPPLIEPGHVAQAVALFDAVGTGHPQKHEDRRLPPSVISGFQIIAADERRGLFKSDHIIDPGMTPDGRFLGVTVAGAHSDIGGSYHRDGLAIRSDNLVTKYLNSLSDRPFVKSQVAPVDPRLNVVHRSEDGMLLFKLGHNIDRQSAEGYNELLVPKGGMKSVSDPYNAEPRDESLSRKFEWRNIETDVSSMRANPSKDVSANDLSSRLDRLLAAGLANDWITFSRENQSLAYGEAGKNMLIHADASADLLEKQAAQSWVQQQSMQPPAPPSNTHCR